MAADKLRYNRHLLFIGFSQKVSLRFFYKSMKIMQISENPRPKWVSKGSSLAKPTVYWDCFVV